MLKISKYSSVVLIVAGCCLAFATNAQKIQAVSFSLQSESVAIPFTRLGKLHPGIEIGVQLHQQERVHTLRRWNAYVGWFHHENLDQNFYLRGEYEFAYNINKTLSIFAPISLGYMHSFHAKPVYEQRSDGSFSEKTQMGRPHAILNLGLGARYLGFRRLEPFVKYEVMAQSPFVATVPVAPRSFLKVGTQIKFN